MERRRRRLPPLNPLRGRFPGRGGSRRPLRMRLTGRPIRPMPILKMISPADIITLMNFLCGVLAVMSSVDKGDGFRTAMLLIMLGVVFDGLDGPVARRFGSSHRFGIWLDSIADAVTFTIAPAILVYNLYRDPAEGFFDSFQPLIVLVSSISIALVGILRLAKFSIYAHKWKDFIGLPTPAMAMTVVSLSAVFYLAPEVGLDVDYLTTGKTVMLPMLFFILSLAMVADVRYRKYHGKAMVISGLIVLALIICLLVSIEEPAVGFAGSLLFSILALSYVLSPITSGPGHIWGAADRARENALEEELFEDEDIEEGEIEEEYVP
ncbi:MAG: CDP-diacylglycerol--serine O-phosphatidyltransferase [Candidatus Thermoplasmatota archaeon]|nr:CDP-diacylglycerol--serine O-phosphatidyltransferase [Candidatus Thermoplasmatota archaeon]